MYPFDKASLLHGVETMNSFGSRTTGSLGHKRFVQYIKDEIASMGLETHSDSKTFDRWEAKSATLVIHAKDGDVPVHVSSPFPYSGETGEEGITAVPVLNQWRYLNFVSAIDKIAVVKVKDLGNIYSGVAFDRKRALPEDLHVQRYYKGPVATSFIRSPFLEVAKAQGVKAMICVWEGMSDAMVEGQYLNFILDYQGIPAVWVNATDGERVLSACRAKEPITLTLLADREKDAVGESVYAMIKGTETERETIIVNTHTDGVNCVEENGPVAMLGMMRYFVEHPPRRTMIFAFVAGHFRLPHFKKPGAISDQASSLWLHDHKELWDGKRGHAKAVAALTVEHLGCTEWKDVDGVYRQTDPIEVEVVYTGNKRMDDIYFASIEGRTKVRTITLRGHNFLHFGEGQPFFNVGVPTIALVTSPDYLCVESEGHEMDKFDPELMYQQTVSFVKMAQIIDQTEAKDLGRADPYSIGISKV